VKKGELLWFLSRSGVSPVVQPHANLEDQETDRRRRKAQADRESAVFRAIHAATRIAFKNPAE
jgi:hypothetical protein